MRKCPKRRMGYWGFTMRLLRGTLFQAFNVFVHHASMAFLGVTFLSFYGSWWCITLIRSSTRGERRKGRIQEAGDCDKEDPLCVC